MSALYELWIYERGEARRVETARYETTLRLLWCARGYRDAAIVMDGELLEHRPGTEPMALRAITAAAQEAHSRAVVVIAPVPEPPAEDDLPLSPELEEQLEAHADALALGPELVGPGPLQGVELPPAAPTGCAARGCTGTPPPGPAPAEIAPFCVAHRGELIRAARRLGTPHPDAARAMRVYGQVTRSTVNLSRAA